LVPLPQLLNAAQNVEAEADTTEDLTLLVRAASSLGGARPKAHLVKPDGSLAIAKFPSTADEPSDRVPQWEHAALMMAREEIEWMAHAFEHEEAAAARRLISSSARSA